MPVKKTVKGLKVGKTAAQRKSQITRFKAAVKARRAAASKAMKKQTPTKPVVKRTVVKTPKKTVVKKTAMGPKRLTGPKLPTKAQNRSNAIINRRKAVDQRRKLREDATKKKALSKTPMGPKKPPLTGPKLPTAKQKRTNARTRAGERVKAINKKFRGLFGGLGK